MNPTSTRLAQQYGAALKRHLKQGPQASLEPALGLGHQTVAIGLETLDLARIHEQALVALIRPGCSSTARVTMTKRAESFFGSANTPIEETHQAARQTGVHLDHLKETLGQRTQELAAANLLLQQCVVRRKAVEDAFEQRGKLHANSVEESLRLQKSLRHLTHQLLLAQEDERKNLSRKLQDEIAQTLLGINLRLLALQKESRNDAKRLKNEIASTQDLVVKSAQSVRRVANKLGKHEPKSPASIPPLSGRAANAPEPRPPRKPGISPRTGQ